MTVPAELPADVADLLAGTLGPGGLPGVLADWIDEHSAAWGPLTAALRAAEPFTPPGRAHYDAPRYLALAPGVVAWLTDLAVSPGPGQPVVRTPVLGFHRTAPGREAAWRLAVPGDAAPLRALFAAPPGPGP